MATWKTTWAQAHTDMSQLCGYAKDHTVKTSVISRLSGSGLRLRLCNQAGNKDTVVAGASLQVSQGELCPVTFDGKTGVTLAPGQWVYSDPVEVPVADGEDITIALAFRGSAVSGNQLTQPVHYSTKGNYVLSDTMPIEKKKLRHSIFGMTPVIPVLSGVEVLTEDAKEVLVCFGDSITQQGHWTGALSGMLKDTVVINKGIGGNRLLSDPMSKFMAMWGTAAVKRFEKDVLQETGATQVVFALGTNDIGMARSREELESCGADRLMETLQELAEKARQAGMKTYIATVTPRGNTKGMEPYHEEERLRLNRLIRESTAFDGVFDFDAVTRNVRQPDIFDSPCDSGDHLHPGPIGGLRMAKEACRVLTEK